MKKNVYVCNTFLTVGLGLTLSVHAVAVHAAPQRMDASVSTLSHSYKVNGLEGMNPLADDHNFYFLWGGKGILSNAGRTFKLSGNAMVTPVNDEELTVEQDGNTVILKGRAMRNGPVTTLATMHFSRRPVQQIKDGVSIFEGAMGERLTINLSRQGILKGTAIYPQRQPYSLQFTPGAPNTTRPKGRGYSDPAIDQTRIIPVG